MGSLDYVLQHRLLVSAISVALLLGFAVPAFADGDPDEKKPEVMTPLDQALDNIQNKEPPVSVEKPAEPVAATPAPAPEPAVVETPPPAAVAVEPAKPPAPAPLSRTVEVQPENTSFFGLSIGMYEPFAQGFRAASLNVEWQPGVKIVGILQPIFGAFITTKGSMMGYGGLGTPFKLGKHVFVMPSFSVGAYGHGDGKDLGQSLAFRAGGEISYEFDDKSRFGINAHIITNGKSTDKDDNAAMIGLVYTTPIDIFSGKPRPDPRAADKAVLEKTAKSVK